MTNINGEKEQLGMVAIFALLQVSFLLGERAPIFITDLIDLQIIQI